MTSKPAIAECFYKENGEYRVKRKYIINTKENPYYSIPPWGDQKPLFQANNPFLSSSFLVKFDKQNDLRDEANRTYHSDIAISIGQKFNLTIKDPDEFIDKLMCACMESKLQIDEIYQLEKESWIIKTKMIKNVAVIEILDIFKYIADKLIKRFEGSIAWQGCIMWYQTKLMRETDLKLNEYVDNLDAVIENKMIKDQRYELEENINLYGVFVNIFKNLPHDPEEDQEEESNENVQHHAPERAESLSSEDEL